MSLERVMVKAPNHLGDLVMAMPALAVVRAACPDARLSVLLREILAPALQLVPWVDEVVEHPWPVGLDLRRHRDIGSRLARRREQKILLLTRSLESALWAALARIPQRCGQPAEGRLPLLTRRLRPTALTLDERQHFEQLAREAFDFDGLVAPTRLSVEASTREALQRRLVSTRRWPKLPLIGIGPSSRAREKCWPADRFARAIDEIHQRRIGECLLIGASTERGLLETIARGAGTPAPRISNDLGLPALAALLEQCDLYCGNDSGPTHLASDLGVRTLAIYFATDPQRTVHKGEHVTLVGPPWERPPAPRHAPTFWTAGRRRRFARRRGLELSVETVVAAIESALGPDAVVYP